VASSAGALQIDYTQRYGPDKRYNTGLLVDALQTEGIEEMTIASFIFSARIPVPQQEWNREKIYLYVCLQTGGIPAANYILPKSSTDITSFLNLLREHHANAAEEELVSVITELNVFLLKREFSLIDAIFNSVDVSALQTAKVLALLRGTYAVRSKLNAWRQLLERSRQEFAHRGLDVAAIFRGL
jgi:hypothetical protein